MPGPLKDSSSIEQLEKTQGELSDVDEDPDIDVDANAEVPSTSEPTTDKPKRKYYRPTLERPLLELRINEWLDEAQKTDPLCGLVSPKPWCQEGGAKGVLGGGVAGRLPTTAGVVHPEPVGVLTRDPRDEPGTLMSSLSYPGKGWPGRR